MPPATDDLRRRDFDEVEIGEDEWSWMGAMTGDDLKDNLSGLRMNSGIGGTGGGAAASVGLGGGERYGTAKDSDR